MNFVSYFFNIIYIIKKEMYSYLPKLRGWIIRNGCSGTYNLNLCKSYKIKDPSDSFLTRS